MRELPMVLEAVKIIFLNSYRRELTIYRWLNNRDWKIPTQILNQSSEFAPANDQP